MNGYLKLADAVLNLAYQDIEDFETKHYKSIFCNRQLALNAKSARRFLNSSECEIFKAFIETGVEK